MAVIFHFKDGTSATITNAVGYRPYEDTNHGVNGDFLELIDQNSDSIAIAPVTNLNYANKT